MDLRANRQKTSTLQIRDITQPLQHGSKYCFPLICSSFKQFNVHWSFVVFLFFWSVRLYYFWILWGNACGIFWTFLVEFPYLLYPLLNNSLSYICNNFPHFTFKLCHFHSEVLTFILSCMSVFATMSFFERSSALQ